MQTTSREFLAAIAAVSLTLCGCASGGDDAPPTGAADTPPSIDAKASCASMVTALSLPDTKIQSAVEVAAGPLPAGTAAPTFPPNTAATTLPAYCKLKATVAPAINFELWMPLAGWNGRFQGVGNHGFAGALDYGDMSYQLSRGYAVASTDTGHAGADPLPWMQNAQQLIDYGYRGVHEMTVNAKAIVAAFYAQPANHNYFNGCSTGGKEALMEAQRYPSDYDGISVGDPNFDQIGNRAQYVWDGQAAIADPATQLNADKLALINKAVLKACDTLDGVADGSIEDPRQCHFQPASLQCAAGQDPASCLSAAQVGALTKIYAGPKDPVTGESVYVGNTVGSELFWGGVIGGPNVFSTADQFFKNMVFKDQNWDYRTFDFDKDWKLAMANFAPILNATDTDLRPFEATGGKILHSHGWKDVNHPALKTVEYYEAVLKALDQGNDRAAAIARTQKFYRLFMVPGSSGCSSAGAWPDVFDPMDALTQWVEKGSAPERMVVSHKTKGVVDRTRPACAYPQVAKYLGSGSTDEAANFSCQ